MIWHLFRAKGGHGPTDSGIRSSDVKPRLIVDISVLYEKDAGTGIQRVVSNVWKRLNELDQENVEIVPVFAKRDGIFYLAHSNFLELTEESRSANPQRCIARAGDIFLGLDFSPMLLPRCKNLLLDWKKLGVPINLIVYDLLPETNPEWFTRRGVRNYRRWLTLLSDYADTALCISSDVARQLRKALHRRGSSRFGSISIEVLHMGTEFGDVVEKSFPPPQLRACEGSPIILMVGTIEPRKGYDFALKVFDRIWNIFDDGPVVVIVGKAGWKTKNLQFILRNHARAGHSFFWFEDVDDRQLAWLYDHSIVFFSTSLAEGLGLPLLEARSFGLPIVATNLPVFHEVSGESGVFFDVEDVSEASRLLADILKGNSSGRLIREAPQATWSDTVSDILQRIMPNGR